MNKVGNIAVGYSASSGSVFPAIRFTGRIPRIHWGHWKERAAFRPAQARNCRT
jgi:hypothetical protein